MTIAQTERPSYRSKKRYAKFGRLQANKDLNMHEPARPRKKYLHKKVSLETGVEPRVELEAKSNSLLRIQGLKQNLRRKSELRQKLAEADAGHAPIQVRRSRKRIASQKGGRLELQRGSLAQLKKLEGNEVRDMLRGEEEPPGLPPAKGTPPVEPEQARGETDSAGGEGQAALPEKRGGGEERPERLTNPEERKTVVVLNPDNEFEIQKLTEEEIKDTHLFQAPREPEREAGHPAIDLNLELENSHIGESLKAAKKSDYGSSLRARVENFQPPKTDLEVPFDYQWADQERPQVQGARPLPVALGHFAAAGGGEPAHLRKPGPGGGGACGARGAEAGREADSADLHRKVG